MPPSNPDTLGNVIGSMQTLLASELQADRQAASAINMVIRRLDGVRVALRSMPADQCQMRIVQYQAAVAGDLLTRLHILAALANPEPPKWGDLPQALVDQFVGRRGEFLMRIYSNADIWDTKELSAFVRDVRSVDPNVTGIPIVTYEASRQMLHGFQWAAVYAFIAVFVLIWLDFCSVRITILAMFPMLFGLIQTFGIMGLFGIPLNPANMIVLPLILAIGIDDGVHIMHDYLRQKEAGQKYVLSRSTAIAIMITTLTATIGFGSLMIASHLGLQSLGRVLIIGVSFCCFSAIILLPAILTGIDAMQEKREAARKSGT